jgi:hypothetical protein
MFNCAEIVVDWAAFTNPDSDHLRDDAVDGVLAFAGTRIFYQCKALPSAANPFGVTGQQLAELEYSRTALKKQAKVQASSLRSALKHFFFVSDAFEGGEVEPPAEGTADYLRKLRKKIVERFNAYLRTLLALRTVTHCLNGIRKIFFIEFRPFRGFAWSKRAWSFLHGSHPPKASAHTAAVGCA